MPSLPDSIEIRLPKKALAGNVAEIKWSDGRVTAHTSFNLRMRCPCATCRDSHNPDPKAIRGPKGVPPMVELASFDWVGNYAVNFVFNDGHNTGIYTFKYLLELDESPNAV
jgi:DUF971 family protein